MEGGREVKDVGREGERDGRDGGRDNTLITLDEKQ